MASRPIQPSLFPDDPNHEPPEPTRSSRLRDRTNNNEFSSEERILEGIPQLMLPTRWELLPSKILHDSVSLRTIIRPVPQAIQVIRNLSEYLRTTGGCQVLVIRADTGSGKTTFLNTLPHYMTDVEFHIQTIDLQFVSEDDFAEELGGLSLSGGGINLIILEGREKPEAISERYIQIVLANINRYSRSKRLPMLFVIPTIEEQVARTWCDHGVKIGDLIPEHKLYEGSRWYTFPGLPRDKFVEITKETVRVLNGRNIEDFGVSHDELQKWTESAPTIGKFMEIVATETSNRRASSMITVKGKREHVWVLFCGPDYKHFDHTYLVVDGLCHDEKMHVSPTKLLPPDTETSFAKYWRDPIQWAKLITTINFLDVRLINFSVTATVSAVLAYGDQRTIDSFKQASIGDYLESIPREMYGGSEDIFSTPLLERRLQTQNARASLERSNLFFLLRGMPGIPTKGFRPEEVKTLAQYLHLMKAVPIHHVHECIASALEDQLKYWQFPGFVGVEFETPFVQGRTDPVPDITIHTETDVYALEFHFFSKQFTSSEMSRYTLRSVIEKYMKSLPHLSSQLTQAYDQK